MPNVTTGVRFAGANDYDYAGVSVAAAGDVNGDGREDACGRTIIGAGVTCAVAVQMHEGGLPHAAFRAVKTPDTGAAPAAWNPIILGSRVTWPAASVAVTRSPPKP